MKLSSMILVLCFVFGGCQIISQNLDDMTDAEYQRVEREIYLITKISCREFFKLKPELKLQTAGVIDSFGSDLGAYIDSGAFLEKFVEKISDPEIKELVELILLEVGKYGGFKYIDTASSMLNERSAGLLSQVVFAIYDAAHE